MTLDDDSSIYVGGLPYDATEESIRRVFDFFGSVVEVKIINDHAVGGKCYGFVTFTNPRSAVDAINGMDGGTIEGRVVRVNEVRTRGGRWNFVREPIRHNSDRGAEWERGRDRERYYDRDRNRYRDRNSDRFQEDDIEGARAYHRGHHQSRNRYLERDRDQDRDMEESQEVEKRSREPEFDGDHDLHWEPDRETDKVSEHGGEASKDDDLQRRKQGSNGHSREFSSESSGDYHDQVKEQLDMSLQRLEELQKEIPLMEDHLEEKRNLVLDLQKKSQKVEDALTGMKKLSSQRHMQLTKLHRCFLQVRDCNERLKITERELESLVDTVMTDLNVVADAGLIDGVFPYVNA